MYNVSSRALIIYQIRQEIILRLSLKITTRNIISFWVDRLRLVLMLSRLRNSDLFSRVGIMILNRKCRPTLDLFLHDLSEHYVSHGNCFRFKRKTAIKVAYPFRNPCKGASRWDLNNMQGNQLTSKVRLLPWRRNYKATIISVNTRHCTAKPKTQDRLQCECVV